MTLTELKYIVAVARERHFGKAADASTGGGHVTSWPPLLMQVLIEHRQGNVGQ